jgi:hypothetical protein
MGRAGPKTHEPERNALFAQMQGKTLLISGSSFDQGADADATSSGNYFSGAAQRPARSRTARRISRIISGGFARLYIPEKQLANLMQLQSLDRPRTPSLTNRKTSTLES